MKRITLKELHERYCESRINLKPRTAQEYLYSILSAERYFGRTLYADEFSENGILKFLKARGEQVAPSTVKRERCDLLLMWRFAHKKGWAPPVAEIPTVRVPAKNPRAWSLDEIEAILRVTAHLRGTMRKLPIRRCDWWTSLVLFGYDTGARLGAMLAIEPADVNLEEAFTLLLADNSKVGIEQVLPLSGQTVEWLAKHFDPNRERVWPYPWHKRKIWLDLHEIASAAGVPCQTGEAFHKLRRTHATAAVNAVGFEAARVNLGHTSEQMTRRYVDRTKVKPKLIPIPRPAIGGEDVA